jgi:uncharacterized protein
MTPTHIVFHGHCPDGTVAAWVLDRALPGAHQLHPYTHGGPVPQPVGGTVWVVDVAFDAATLDAWAQRCDRIIVLDHHVTNAELLAERNDPLELTLQRAADPDWRGVTVSIVMERSGAGLAADAAAAVAPGFEVPAFVLDIEDRDLWRWARTSSRQVCAALDGELDGLELTGMFAALDTLNDRPRAELIAVGAEHLALFDATVDELCDQVQTIRIDRWQVPMVQVPQKHYGSQVGHTLLHRHPDAPFAAYWYRDDDSIQVGLRSDDRRVDVSQVAASFGGGGHRNASGLSCRTLDDLARRPAS